MGDPQMDGWMTDGQMDGLMTDKWMDTWMDDGWMGTNYSSFPSTKFFFFTKFVNWIFHMQNARDALKVHLCVCLMPGCFGSHVASLSLLIVPSVLTTDR